MLVKDAPYLSALQGAQLRTLAVKLQNHVDTHAGSKPAVLAFWQSQKTLAAEDSGHPSDGTYVPGVKDLRMTCYRVLSHYRSFDNAGLANYIAFCDFFIQRNVSPLVLVTNVPETKEVQAGATLSLAIAVAGGAAPYTYAWYKDGDVIEGRVSASFSKASAVVEDAGTYHCLITDSVGQTVLSGDCVVTVTA